MTAQVAPFGRRSAEVLSCGRVGAYDLLKIRDPSGPRPLPGQFFMLACERGWGAGVDERPFLPRALSHARAIKHADGIELWFLLESVGPGTARLGACDVGESIWITGPLGNGFEIDSEREVVLVGGGIGAAPILALQDDLDDAPPALLGFRDADHAHASSLFDAGSSIATDDGTAGHHGLVTELLSEALDGATEPIVFACGPPAMLEAVRAICAERGIPAQLAMESGMACGYGACFGCVVPTRAGYVRLCLDGPVLAAADLETALVAGAGH